MRTEALRAQEVFVFEQRFQNVRVENSGVQALWQQGKGLVSVTGRVFNDVRTANQRKLTPAQALDAANAYVRRSTRLSAKPPGAPELVLFPYADALRYAWRVEVHAEEGDYRLWIDADMGRVLQLEPLFYSDSGTGLVFNPDPLVGTDTKNFEVDPASSNQYRLQLAGKVSVSNLGADGVTNNNLTIAASGGTANFNVAPINGTVVARTNMANYNSRFQEVNAFGWVYSNMDFMKSLGSQDLTPIAVNVNDANPCGFGKNNACGGIGFVRMGVGQATISNSTTATDFFNAAIDATVLTHEFGHGLSGKQVSVGGGTMTGALNEGLSDFWAATIHNTPTFGNFWGQNQGVPVETGFAPRQADPLDVFPSHRRINNEIHADGQIINWALWNTRTGLNNAGALGTLVIEVDLLKALTTTGAGMSACGGFNCMDKQVHDSYLDLLQKLAAQFGNNVSTINKLFSGFSRAGIFVSERDAIIDIDRDFLARGGPPPTFTVWTGRNYQFDANQNAVTQNVFNTQFTIEVANDAAFTTNRVTSGALQGVAAGPGGVPTATWTLSATDWNTLKAANQLYYRVTTTDANGANVRISTSPGNGFMGNVPPANAVINESGKCECTCSTVVGAPGSGLPWIIAVPFLIALVWRLRLRKELQCARA